MHEIDPHHYIAYRAHLLYFEIESRPSHAMSDKN